MGGLTSGRPRPTPERASARASSRRRAGALPAILAIAALIGSCAGPAPTVSPVPGYAVPVFHRRRHDHLAPATTVAPVPSLSAAPTTWARLTLADAPAVADLQPTKSGAAGSPSTPRSA